MSVFGVTSAGFIRKTAADLKSDIEADHVAEFGKALRREVESVFGQLIGVETGSFDLLWQMIEKVVWSRDPRRAVDAALDAVAALWEVYRKPATFSTVVLVLTGTASTVVAAGKVASTDDGASRFAVIADATILAATAWGATSSVALGSYRTKGGQIYRAIMGGTTGTTGPTVTDRYPTTEVDGTVTWVWVGAGAGYVEAAAQCTVTGPVGAASYSIETIASPVSGWSGVASVTDALAGSDVESDDELRVRLKASLHSASAVATLDAILGHLLALVDLDEGFVYENVEHDTNTDGVPGHAIEAVHTGAVTDLAVATMLLGTKAAGIKAYGTTTTVVADTKGKNHRIGHTTAAPVSIYLDVVMSADQRRWPSESATDVASRGTERAKAMILAYGTKELTTGVDVDPSAISGAAFPAGTPEVIPGSLGVVSVKLGTAPSPSGTDLISINQRQIARLDTARINVSVVFRAP